jgi:hypothetical protein
MKKILAVLITLVLAGSAFAVTGVPDVQLTPLSGGLSEITVDVSDTFYVDILASATAQGDATLLINAGELLITIEGNAEFIGNEDFTYWSWWGMGVGTNLFEYVDSKTLRMTTGYVGVTAMFMMPLPDAVNGNLAIDHIGIHCTAPGDVTITVAAANVAKPWGQVFMMTSEGAATDHEALGGELIVHQIPEPMTVLLLGLGGLFLRRRK